MTFVNFGLLAGALFVAVPIVLHLVMRQQPQHVEFPPLRFLKVRREANRRRLRLRQLLLLALRVAALGLLALALARPSIRGSGLLGGQEAPVAAAFLFDTAARMDYQRQNLSRLQVAQARASTLLRQLPRDSQVAVLDGRGSPAAFAVDLGAAKQRVERLRVTPLARSLTEMLADGLRLLADSELMRREVYVFTDLTKSAWPQERAGDLQAVLSKMSEVRLYLIDVGVDDPQNFALGGLRLSRQLVAQNSPLSLTAELVRTGPEDRRMVELLLIDDDGTPRKRGQASPTWQASEVRQAEFHLAGLPAGTHQGYVRLVGEDALKWDDVNYFTIEVRPPWRVLVAAARRDHAEAFAEVLAPRTFRESGRSRFACDIVGLPELEAESLDDYAAVCLLDPSPPSATTWQRLYDYVEGGGALAIFLGRHAQPLTDFNQATAQRLLPGALKRVWRESTFLAPRDLHHSMLAAFRPWEGSIPWSDYPVLRFWQLAQMSADASTIIRYASGHPAVVERAVGEGRVLTITTPVSDPVALGGRDPWNLFTRTDIEPWPFVMLANEMMLYLVGQGEERFNYLVGQAAVLRLPKAGTWPMVSLTTPGGDRVRQSVDLQRRSITVTATDQPGNYQLRAGGQQAGLDRGFSANLDPQTNRLDRLELEGLTGLLGEGRFRIARNREQIERDVNVGRVGQELFPYLILLVALALAIEHSLANRFYRGRKVSG